VNDGGHVDQLGNFERGTVGFMDWKKPGDRLVNGDLWQPVLKARLHGSPQVDQRG
jgi:hypothetical protein